MFNAFRHLIIIIIAMFLMACGNSNASQTDNHPIKVVKQVIQVVVDDPDLIPAVDYGIGWWSDANHNELVRVDSCDPSAFCTHVRFMTPDERTSINAQYGNGKGEVGGLTSNDRTLVRMNKDLTLGYLPSGALNISVSHELGHVQGFQHSKDPGDLMFVQPTFTGTICIQGKACREFS